MLLLCAVLSAWLCKFSTLPDPDLAIPSAQELVGFLSETADSMLLDGGAAAEPEPSLDDLEEARLGPMRCFCSLLQPAPVFDFLNPCRTSLQEYHIVHSPPPAAAPGDVVGPDAGPAQPQLDLPAAIAATG